MDYQAKVIAAEEVIAACRTDKGFHASTHLYPELWMRDLVLSEDVLLRLGYLEDVRNHLERFLKMQRASGELPAVITTPLRRTFNQSFHFWTSDTEVFCLIGMWKYATFVGDLGFLEEHAPQMEKCLGFIKGKLDASGFLPGMDWRDAITNYAGEELLANQTLLVEAYNLMGSGEAGELRSRIRQGFLLADEPYLADSRGKGGAKSHRLDSFGNSMAIVQDILGGKTAYDAAGAMLRSRTPHGYPNVSPPHRINRLGPMKSFRGMNAFLRNGAVFRNGPRNYQNSAIWPFVESRIARALLKVGRGEEARELARMMLGRDGFAEWYSPISGEPHGSPGQLWTAAAVLDVAEILS